MKNGHELDHLTQEEYETYNYCKKLFWKNVFAFLLVSAVFILNCYTKVFPKIINKFLVAEAVIAIAIIWGMVFAIYSICSKVD